MPEQRVQHLGIHHLVASVAQVEVIEKRRAWAEQYLLQAFLAYNDEFEVVLPLHALAREELELVCSHVPSGGGRGTGPGTFWIRRGRDQATA